VGDTPKALAITAIVIGGVLLLLIAISHPALFSSQKYLAGLLGFECLVAAVWLYKRVFFPLLLLSFLLAGVDLPLSSTWMMARWVVLGVGAAVGSVLMLRERRHHFGAFHAFALFAVLGATVSAAVSQYPVQSSMKVVSLFCLFLYAATGARVAVSGRENRFFAGLLTGCEVLVAVIAVFYLSGIEVLGNPNSLGAIMGVVAAPMLLWGTLLKQEPFAQRRRTVFFIVAFCLTFYSQARAALLAEMVSCGLLCLVLRKYRLLAFGFGIIAIFAGSMAIIRPDAFSELISVSTSAVVYKGKDPGAGIMASRLSTWRDTTDTIEKHVWFGTGFGTSDNGHVDTSQIGRFASTSAISTEHGSSYLALFSWVGIVGVLPFGLLLATVFSKLIRIVVSISRTCNPAHPAVPLAILVVAGLTHAFFEDWLFAPGYYLCVFFWSIAFLMVDQVPSLVVPDWRSMFVPGSNIAHPDLRTAVPNR